MADDYRHIRIYVLEPACCRQCDEGAGVDELHRRFVVCKTCGNKRCPKAEDHRNDCTGSNESNQRVTRNRSTPESREFWDSVEKAAAAVATWPDERRAGINVSDRRQPACAICHRKAPGGISRTIAGTRYELCDMHSSMGTVDVVEVARMKAENDSLKRELHRWQTGTQIEGDYVEHWISRSDYEELERRCDGLERDLAPWIEEKEA